MQFSHLEKYKFQNLVISSQVFAKNTKISIIIPGLELYVHSTNHSINIYNTFH